MVSVVRSGFVAWYDATRGYGFVKDTVTNAPVFITHAELREFGLTGLPKDQYIEFDVIQGRASDKVRTIKGVPGATLLH